VEKFKKTKPGRIRVLIMDELVSTGNFHSLHNIKNYFIDKEKYSNIFYTQFLFVLWKRDSDINLSFIFAHDSLNTFYHAMMYHQVF
jgi:hypothetical protein